MPSYLSSTQTGGRIRRSASASSATGEASIDLSGWKSVSRALASASWRASTAVRPMSPVSMPAQRTSARSRSKAAATADFQVTRAQADAQLTAQDGHHVACRQRVSSGAAARLMTSRLASMPRAAATAA